MMVSSHNLLISCVLVLLVWGCGDERRKVFVMETSTASEVKSSDMSQVESSDAPLDEADESSIDATSSKSLPEPGAPTAKVEEAPMGFFRTLCFTAPGDPTLIIDATWTQNHLSTLVKIYSDPQCRTVPKIFSYEMDYTVSGKSALIDGAVNYDLVVKAKDLQTGQTSTFKTYSIFKIIDADTVAVGEKDRQGNDGTTLEKRFKILSPDYIYKRVK